MSAKNTIREIKKATKKRFTAEQKIQIVLEGLRGEPKSLTFVDGKVSQNLLITLGLKHFLKVARML